MKCITPQNTVAVGPYSPAIKINNFVFTSGQIGVNEESKLVSDNITEQTKRALCNLKTVINAAGANICSIVKVTIFLTNMDDYTQVNEIYGAFLEGHKPARSTVAVAKLPMNAKIEIEAIAITNGN